MTPSTTKHKADASANGEVIHPVCSELIEDWLRTRGVSFSPCQRIAMSSIRRKESRANQARREALDPDLVERYRQALANGETFPPIVVIPQAGGNFIIDGNHRDEAYVRAREQHITAYVIDADTSSEVVELLVAEANVRHGKPTDTEWRGVQAAYLLSSGQTTEVVANALGLSRSGVEAARRALRSNQRAAKLGVKRWANVSQTTRASLASVSADSVFQALCDLITTHGLPGADLRDALGRIKSASSESEALAIVGEMEEDVTARRRAAGSVKRLTLSNPRMRLLSAIGAVIAIPVDDVHRLFRTQRERDEVKNRAALAAIRLMEIEEALNDA